MAMKKKKRDTGDTHLYSSAGKELDPETEQKELVVYWKTIYRKHQNDIKDYGMKI